MNTPQRLPERCCLGRLAACCHIDMRRFRGSLHAAWIALRYSVDKTLFMNRESVAQTDTTATNYEQCQTHFVISRICSGYGTREKLAEFARGAAYCGYNR